MKTNFDHFECNTCRYMFTVEEMINLITDLPCPRCGDWLTNSHFIKGKQEPKIIGDINDT